jgi:hypothetical protein
MRKFEGSIGRTGWSLGSLLLSGVALLALGGPQPAYALIIDVSYPDQADVPLAAQNDITNVVNFVDNSFTNNATINVTVDFTSTCGLGCSSTARVGPTYTQWTGQMATDSAANPQNTFLKAAVATLPATDPLNSNISGTSVVAVRSANARALGFSVAPGNDSALTFTNASNTFEYNGVSNPALFDFTNVFEHELDEGLGVGSTLTGIANNGTLPTFFEPEDYFRYNSTGSRSITTNPAANVFFSYNGITDVAQFNQDNNAGGNVTADRNDWIYGNAGCPPSKAFVQNAIGCPGEIDPYGPGTPEFAVLETLGYNLAPVPAPLIGFGLPAFLAIGGLLFGAKLLERGRRGVGPFDAA